PRSGRPGDLPRGWGADHCDECKRQRRARHCGSGRGRAHAWTAPRSPDRHGADARRRAVDHRRRDGDAATAGARGRDRVERDSDMAGPRTNRSSGVAHCERAALVGLIAGRARRLEAERSLDELGGLAEAAGAEVVLRVLQERPKPDPSTFLGAGKIQTLAASAAETDVDLVIFDNELTPAQLRQIEEEVGRKIVDRTQLILDIFARRARTREGKLQVERAQLKYLLPRLVGAGAALSRLGGGIGTRGPGETKLETDRRRIRTRIHAIADDIEQVRKRRAQLRERRHKSAVPTVALVGYTNAGKTTLFNRLTKAGAEAS